MSVSFRVTQDTATPMLRRQAQALERLPQGAYSKWRDVTPVRSGNARRRTRLSGDTIQADYPYAQRLDRGWSRQAPLGMFRPTLQWVRAQLARIFRG